MAGKSHIYSFEGLPNSPFEVLKLNGPVFNVFSNLAGYVLRQLTVNEKERFLRNKCGCRNQI